MSNDYPNPILGGEAEASILNKISPRSLKLSPKMRFILDCVTGQDYGARGLRGESPMPLSITSDGFIIVGSMFIGEASDLERNVEGVLKTVEATKAEREAFNLMYKKHVTDWR